MKKIQILFLMLLLLPAVLQAQYSENHKKFLLGSVSDKITIIVNQEGLEETDYGLLQASLKFCIDSSPVLADAKEVKELLLKTLSAVKPIVTDDFFPLLLQVYKTYPYKEITIPLFHIMSGIRITDASLIQDMYAVVSEESQKHFSQRSNELLTAAVTALGSVHDSRLFANLFPCLFLELDEDVASLIFSVLSQSIQQYKADSIKIIAGENVNEKRVVFDLASQSTHADDFFKAEIAENTLSSTINHSEDAAEKSREVIDLQLDSMRVIKNTKWTRSSLLMTTYFTIAQNQYTTSLISRNELIEVIECLTALATTDTGKALTDYLGILNDTTEKSGTYDEVLLLAVIRSIGTLGEKSAFDNLLYVILYQGYPDSIISASKEALAKLNW